MVKTKNLLRHEIPEQKVRNRQKNESFFKIFFQKKKHSNSRSVASKNVFCENKMMPGFFCACVVKLGMQFLSFPKKEKESLGKFEEKALKLASFEFFFF